MLTVPEFLILVRETIPDKRDRRLTIILNEKEDKNILKLYHLKPLTLKKAVTLF